MFFNRQPAGIEGGCTVDAFLKKEAKPFLRIETNLLVKLSNSKLAKFTMETVFNELHELAFDFIRRLT